jgi:predicted nucleic acid-binding protein
LIQEDYERAAEISNICRKRGIQGSLIDFLVCASALNRSMSVFTTEKDFANYKKVLNLKLHKVRDEIQRNFP